jgi:hypothetical protein
MVTFCLKWRSLCLDRSGNKEQMKEDSTYFILTQWSTVLRDASSLSSNSLSFMETEASLTSSQEAASGPYPEADKSCPHSHTIFVYDTF